jgi:IMP dehydrogenase
MKLPTTQIALTLDEVSLIPASFSEIGSRADTQPFNYIFNCNSLPIISSNMDTVYSPALAKEVVKHGGISIVHRFCSIEDNVKLFKDGVYTEFYNNDTNFADHKPWVSIGSSEEEFSRAEALISAGAEVIVIDLAMGNSLNALLQYNKLRQVYKDNIKIIVSDFSTPEQLNVFNQKVGYNNLLPDGFTIGQGVGSACETRLVTGIGIPSATMIDKCVQVTEKTGQLLILNGGIKNPQDVCKAIALGCDAVIVGRLFAACVESGAHKSNYTQYTSRVYKDQYGEFKALPDYAVYRGSASKTSYEIQHKVASWRTAEGKEFTIEVSGTVQQLMQRFEAALRSSMSYLNANTIAQYRENAKFMIISNSGTTEGTAYGSKK